MPRFFIDIRVNGETSRDEDGAELPDLETARSQATLAEIIKEAKDIAIALGAAIRDENGQPVCEVDTVVRRYLH